MTQQADRMSTSWPHTTSRRGFNALLLGGILAGALGIGKSIDLPNSGPLQRNLRALRLSNFLPLAGAQFLLTLPDQMTLKLTLDSVRDQRRAGRASSADEQFELTFSGPTSVFLEQATYRLWNRHLGQFDLFLVPGGTTGKRRSYLAVINRPSTKR